MRVFVLCPAGVVTGGPEALHQLHDAGERLGFDMQMVYDPPEHADPVPQVFKMYRPRIARAVPDQADCAVIAPETQTLALAAYQHAVRVVWWLSVDNFTGPQALAELNLPSPIRCAPEAMLFGAAGGCVHWAQSEYAQRFVASKGCTAHSVTDYIRDEIIEAATATAQTVKRNIVAFNPKKGLAFTRELMAASPPDIQWVPIIHMTPRQVSELLGQAKVYVDFGAHPGRDRIPREAALCGCVVITGTQGSAGNDIDLPIPAAFKIDERLPMAVPLILHRIQQCMQDHPQALARLEPYRQTIRQQKAAFTDEVFQALASLEASERLRLQAARETLEA
jgi:hypothetical protein